ncbi:trypsin-like cysteine/serine peptidase domain-containing protein [Aspergillus tamarii]|uniref:Trypsin-like cysteine/serine peptidase domain-containing protein n=1 Tax=Aspergillus tamarii TaxID=41984 RepID=A0A5N6V4M0_ASPTM|nr:trypsin-like cysteine/serine peptidase domain-containing protein [Aspergillus tamarii]
MKFSLLTLLSAVASAQFEKRIVGGTPAAPEQFPYQAAVYESGKYICGGTIIASNKILTAAQCVYGSETSPFSFSIRYGSLSRSGGQSITVSKISRHGQYNNLTMAYDVAVLTLASAITPGPNFSLAKLAKNTPEAGASCSVSGWGRTSPDGALSEDLQVANVNIIDHAVCVEKYSPPHVVDRRMICAGASDGRRGACTGDVGSPLIDQSSGQQVGIVSWSKGCGDDSQPDIYTNTAELSNWILSQ